MGRDRVEGRKYTPLYENDIKKTQNKSMETTAWVIWTSALLGASTLVGLTQENQVLELYYTLKNDYVYQVLFVYGIKIIGICLILYWYIPLYLLWHTLLC